MATIVSNSHLPYARLLTAAVARLHPELKLVTLVADLRLGESSSLPTGEAIAAEQLGLRDLPWLALKFTMAELCCALKPFLIRHLFARGAEAVVYLDSDLDLHAPLDALLEALKSSRFVVTPHLLEPIAESERRREPPSLGELAYNGWINAGLFAVRADESSSKLLAAWSDLCTSPAAFLHELGGLSEQAAFNQLLVGDDSTTIVRDPGYNVAYWNLHERPLRWSGFDGDSDEFRVGDRPLVAFHFSGFDPADFDRLSGYHRQPWLQRRPSVARLTSAYRDRLLAVGWQPGAVAGRWQNWLAGDPIARATRQRIKLLETEGRLTPDLDPWTAEGEREVVARLLEPQAGHPSLIPRLFLDSWLERADLQAAYPEAPLDPHRFLSWAHAQGAQEMGVGRLLDCYRNTVPFQAAARKVERLGGRRPELFEGLAAPLGADRPTLVARLLATGQTAVARAVALGTDEVAAESPVGFLRALWTSRADLQKSFPDPLGADADGFRAWLDRSGRTELLLPEELFASFDRVAGERALARIFAWCLERRGIVAAYPLAFVGIAAEGLAGEFLAGKRSVSAPDAEDATAFLWILRSAPWRGLPWLLELPAHQNARPSSLTHEGQERLLAPVLKKSRRFRLALERYREVHSGAAFDLEAAQTGAAAPGGARAALKRFGARAARRGKGATRSRTSDPLHGSGINLFGSSARLDELGPLSHGASLALTAAGVSTAQQPFWNPARDFESTSPELLRLFRADWSVNLFVAEANAFRALCDAQPRHRGEGRTNVAQLLWAQRDFHPDWAAALDQCDEIWAPARFGAGALERGTGRSVMVIPPALASSAPPRRRPERGTNDPFDVVFLLDDPGALRRLDPLAALEAFRIAFAANEPARLLLRLTNPEPVGSRDLLRELVDRASGHPSIRIEIGALSAAEIDRLLRNADCLLSLHRACAFGYRCAQAMLHGTPVVATGYSGNLDFMTADNSLLVGATEVEVDADEGAFCRGAVWARPDLAQAAEQLRRLFCDQELARRLGERGRADIERQLAPEVVGALMLDRLQRLQDGKNVAQAD